MKTAYGHLSYCTNIHSGETWQEHFNELNKAIPFIKDKVSPALPFGIGLRLSNTACTDLSEVANISAFKKWLNTNNCYVFTMNGFPFGNFHAKPVKEEVYSPDWATQDRVTYTIRLFDILKELLPEEMEGSISTSPLSYRHWFKSRKEIICAYEKCTMNILEVVVHLIKVHLDTGKILHLDLEPEPDGLLENSTEFIEWYKNYYIPLGIDFIERNFGVTGNKAHILLKRHLRLCHDVCHSAIAFEETEEVIKELKKHQILIGKVQISSALKIHLKDNRHEKIKYLSRFNEPIYLHQAIAKDEQDNIYKFKDLTEALDQLVQEKFYECRVHFHVPVFSESFDLLSSTQSTILETLSGRKICDHWEVETYTWNILPADFQLPINESISRELEWVLNKMSNRSINE